MDYSRDPEYTESKLLDKSLPSVGCTSPEDKEITREGGWRNLLSKFRSDHHLRHIQDDSSYGEEHRRMVMLHNASGVGENIVKAAQSYVKVNLTDAVQVAFDCRIFITTSMFETFIEKYPILYLVIPPNGILLKTSFRTIEILLLSLYPTEGLLSLAFMTFLTSVQNAIGAVHNRDHERCADELGIKLTAMACYDTRAASQVFYKMHLQNVESGKGSSANKVGWGGLMSFFDSHPPSDERFCALLDESGQENREKYDEKSCRDTKTMFLNVKKPSDDEGRRLNTRYWRKEDFSHKYDKYIEMHPHHYVAQQL